MSLSVQGINKHTNIIMFVVYRYTNLCSVSRYLHDNNGFIKTYEKHNAHKHVDFNRKIPRFH